MTRPAGKQLFDWDELAQLEVSSDNDLEEVDFRFVESEMGIQPDGLQVTLGYNHRHCFPIWKYSTDFDLQRYGLPQDFNDLAEGTDADKLADFLKLQRRGQDRAESSDEETWSIAFYIFYITQT